MHQANSPLRRIVVVGGGAAGWLTASIIAVTHKHDDNISVTLVESPDVSILGVGEGTWPTMRSTLLKIGISEETFLAQCNASFKQGTSFHSWVPTVGLEPALAWFLLLPPVLAPLW